MYARMSHVAQLGDMFGLRLEVDLVRRQNDTCTVVLDLDRTLELVALDGATSKLKETKKYPKSLPIRCMPPITSLIYARPRLRVATRVVSALARTRGR